MFFSFVGIIWKENWIGVNVVDFDVWIVIVKFNGEYLGYCWYWFFGNEVCWMIEIGMFNCLIVDCDDWVVWNLIYYF